MSENEAPRTAAGRRIDAAFRAAYERGDRSASWQDAREWILAIEAEAAAPGAALTAEALDRIIELLMPKPWGDSAQGGRRWADVDEALGVAQSARSIRLAPAAPRGNLAAKLDEPTGQGDR